MKLAAFLFLAALLAFKPQAEALKAAEEGYNKKSAARSLKKEASKFIKSLLSGYKKKGLVIKVEQEIFLPYAQTHLKSRGLLSLQRKKFRLEMRGEPRSLVLFDGAFLWYQADTEEKIVFKLKKSPQIQILTEFFNEELFFKLWEIKAVKKSGAAYALQLAPLEKNGLKEAFMKAHSHISELRLVWEGLDSWQKYKLSKPFHKDISEKTFQFSSEGFDVISKIEL